MNLTGFRTIIVGLITAIVPGALQYLGVVDWTQLGISAPIAFAIQSVIMLAMRYVSATPIAKPNAVAAVAAMPDEALLGAGIAKILTEPTAEGKALAALSPGKVVAVVANPSLHTGLGRRA